MNGRIDKKVFEEYQEHEKQKTILLHKILICFFLIINIICIIFIVVFKYESYTLNNANLEMKTKLVSEKEFHQSKDLKVQRRLLNIIAMLDLRNNFLSDIIHTKKEYDMIQQWMKYNETYMYMCYQSSSLDDKAQYYRDYCLSENQLFLIETFDHKRFGGFISRGPTNFIDDMIKDKEAFLFSLDNNKKFPVRDSNRAFSLLIDGFFRFGDDDLVISDNFYNETAKESISKFPSNYGTNEDTLEDLTGGNSRVIKVLQLEIYICIFKP